MKSVTNDKRDVRIYYCPHGMNLDWYYPVTEKEEVEKLEKFKQDVLNNSGGKERNFIVLWINRNIRRKQPGDVILAYKTFCDGLSKEEADKCLLVMHTSPVDDNGTDLYAVKNKICPEYDVVFSAGHMDEVHMNYLHNMADVTINIANNEGFGLTTCESLAAGTPIIVNVTGGLQDQCGFQRNEDGEELTADDYVEIGSLHDWKKWEGLGHGAWAFPVWPKVRSLNGSPPTPYIFDDRVDFEDVANVLHDVYNMSESDRKNAGMAGHNWVKNGILNQDYMCEVLMDGIDETLENWKPVNRFTMYKI